MVISLLFYFPCDEHCAGKGSKEKEHFDGEKCPLGNTPSVDVSPDSMSSDLLLAQAISRIEIEKKHLCEAKREKLSLRKHRNSR